MHFLEKIKNSHSIRIKETEQERSNLNIESEIQSNVEKIELRGLGWCFFKFISMTVFLF